MKNVWNSTAATLLCLAATLLLTTACSQENTVDPTLPQGEPVEVQFQIPGFVEMGDGGTTRATSALPEGTTVRIVACMGGDTPSTSRLPDADQTYYVKNGRLVPCTVDKDGKFVSETPNAKMVLEPDSYFFWACTPALEITEASDGSGIYSVSVPQNMDFALSSSENKIITFNGMVVLNPFERKCARLQLKVKRDDASTGITAMTVNSATLTGFNADSQETYITYWFDHILVGTGTKSATTTAFTKDATNPLISTGDLFLLPTTSDIKPTAAIPIQASFNVTYTALGIEYNETFTGNLNLSVARGKSYTLNATISRDGGIGLTVEKWEENNQNNNIGGHGYPYVINPAETNANYVISQDLYGSSGVAFHPIWTGTGVHPQSHGFSKTVSPRFQVYSQGFTADSWDDAIAQCSKLGSGWRLPTITEGLLITPLKNSGKLTISDNNNFSYHWSSTYTTPNHVMITIESDGRLFPYEIPKINTAGVRCIKDSNLYPYFTYNAEGKARVIVNKDKYGTISTERIHGNYLVTPTHVLGDEQSGVAAISEIAKSDAPNPTDPTTTLMSWYVATNPENPACKAPWRLPTGEEARLIKWNIDYLEIDKLAPNNLDFYWTASTANNGNIFCVEVSTEIYINPTDGRGRVRCIRDL